MCCVPTICLAIGPLLQVFSQTHFRKWSLAWMKIHSADFLSHRHQNTQSLTISQKERKKVKSLSHVQLFVTPWTLTHQATLSLGIIQARILEWVAISFFRGSFQPRDRTWVSCIAGRYFTLWATREDPNISQVSFYPQVSFNLDFSSLFWPCTKEK